MPASIDTAERALVVTRLIDAPRALVFRAWTQPEHIARWWGPQGFTTIAGWSPSDDFVNNCVGP